MKKTVAMSVGMFLAGSMAFGQTAKPAPVVKKGDRAAAYYYYSLGHLYGELATAYGNKGEYLSKAIDNYRLALRADAGASFLSDELADLYIQSNRLREGVQDAEEALRQNADDLGARRILGRIYTRLIGDPQQGKIDEGMLRRAIEQYQKISEKSADDPEIWLMLGRLYKVAQNSVDAEKAYKKALSIDANNEDALTGLAMVYSDLGDTKQATEMLRRVVDKSPTPRTVMALAAAYEQMREYTLAAETYKRALELVPDNPEIRRAMAQARFMAEQYPEALEIYRQLAQDDPKDVQSFLRMSQIYRQQRDYAKAREASEQAKQIDPNSLEVRYNEVNLLEAEGKNTEAIAALKDLVDATGKKPGGPPERANRVLFLERLGSLYRGTEQYAQAVAAFRQMEETDADQGPRAEAQIIETYRIAKDLTKAEAEASAAQKKYPNDRVVRAARASLLAETGKTDLAVAEMRKMLDGKNDRETYLALAQVYDKGKNYVEMGKAIDAAEKLSTTNEEKEGIYFTRGAMYEKTKRYDAAESEFRKVLAINPQSASALNYLGYMLADRSLRLPEAQQMIVKALEIDPNNGAYLDSLGWVYYRQGKLPEAETALRQAIERYSKDPTVHDHLGDVLAKAGKWKEAVTQWETALKNYESTPASELDSSDVTKIQKKVESGRVRLARESSTGSAKQR